MARVLKKAFYARPTLEVAQDLLGQCLCRRLDSGKIVRGRICETEAYDGYEDRASHAHRGPTTRNVVMFGPPGYAYLYLCYGIHWLLNITTVEKGYPAAVLVRGVLDVNGPGRLTKHFQIDGRFNNQLLTRVGGLWVESVAEPAPKPDEIETAPRVGIDYAGPEWAAKPWRFIWKPR